MTAPIAETSDRIEYVICVALDFDTNQNTVYNASFEVLHGQPSEQQQSALDSDAVEKLKDMPVTLQFSLNIDEAHLG